MDLVQMPEFWTAGGHQLAKTVTTTTRSSKGPSDCSVSGVIAATNDFNGPSICGAFAWDCANTGPGVREKASTTNASN